MKILLTPRGKNHIEEKDYVQLMKDIEEFSKFSEKVGTNIYLVGGLGESLLKGTFERKPHDIDVAVFFEDFEKFYRNIDREGYKLVRKISHGHISSSYDYNIVKDVSLEQAISNEFKKLKIIRKTKKPFVIEKSRMSFLDLFLWEDRGEKIYVRGEGIKIPFNLIFPIYKYQYKGKWILIPNPEHRNHVLSLKGVSYAQEVYKPFEITSTNLRI